MKTKISMKTIYLILVITVGLVGLGIGSTLAVFTASAEISNPISFSSNLSYNGDIFDTVEVTIGPNATRTTNVSIFNDEQIDGVKYAVWYIYEGNSNDISFVRNQESDIDPSGTDIGQGGTLSMDIKNNTSNTITITIGVTTSKEDIVLPSYMKVITLATVAKYNLTLTKGTGISIMYYKINGSNTYASTTNSSITVSVNEGSTYYYYGIASTGYAMNSCSLSSGPCSGTMGASAVTKTLTASANSYNLTLSKGTGVSTIYYRVNGATNYSSSTASKTVAVKYGTTYYYYGTASTGYTMSSCTLSSPCSGTMGAGAVTKSLTATANSYNLTLNKGTGVSTIYYKVNGASSYTSTTTNKTLSVNSGTTYYYYGVPQTGYTMNSCTSSSPCSGTMTSSVTKTLTASRKTYTISYNANGGTGAPSSQTKTYGITLTLSNTKPVKIGYPFLGWTINSSGTGTLYQPGGSFTTNANTTLYAKYSTTKTSYTVKLNVDVSGYNDTATVLAGDKYEVNHISVYQQDILSEECTNGQTISCGIEGNTYFASCTIASVTADTECTVFSNDQLM